jgi:hypothetical protein
MIWLGTLGRNQYVELEIKKPTASGNPAIAVSADLTVYPGPTLPIGTIIWSNPGDGSGVQKIVPAVPSTTGVADVFALQADCTVQAITSDGKVGWTTNIGMSANGYGCKNFISDFQGGIVATDYGTEVYQYGQGYRNSGASVQRFDGLTGVASPQFSISSQTNSAAGTSERQDANHRMQIT